MRKLDLSRDRAFLSDPSKWPLGFAGHKCCVKTHVPHVNQNFGVIYGDEPLTVCQVVITAGKPGVGPITKYDSIDALLEVWMVD